MQYLILKGPTIHAENRIFKHGEVVISKATISAVSDQTENHVTDNVLEFPENWHIVPGFIDTHIHGAAASDVMDADVSGLEKISRYLVNEGVTSFLATTMTASVSKIENALQAVSAYYPNQVSGGAELVGINLEGPFLNPKKCGAQPLDDLITPDVSLFQKWQELSGNLIKIATIAPELLGALPLIDYLCSQNINPAFGHSDADYETGRRAIASGINHVTHLFNAMRGIEHRNPNAITALLLDPNVTVEIIADGIHVHPAILELVFKLKTADKIILISDAMRAKGLKDGNYDFVGQTVIVKEGVARLENGNLASSILRLDQALCNMIKFTGCTFTEALKTLTENPARKIGIFDRKGSIAAGKDADLVVLDENYQVRMTIARGVIVKQVR